MRLDQIKQDFPIFKKNPSLVYLDSTATTLKPQVVIDKLVEYYTTYSANVFRGIYKLSEKATEEYENTRRKVAKFINADEKEIVFTRNTTESINLVAYALGRKIIERGDEVVVSLMEHHSNFVPWQQLSFENEAVFKVVDITEEGLLQEAWEQVITKRTKIVALTYVSNVLGTINPIKQIIEKIRRLNPKVIIVIDAAQAVSSINIDVKELDCDFLAFSSHKMLGPTGVGVLYGKLDLLQESFPFLYGGEMIRRVEIDRTIFAEPPHKFEAGTPAIGEVIALSAAIDYLNSLGLDSVRKHLKELSQYAYSRLKEEFEDEIRFLGQTDLEKKTAIFSFTFGKYHPHDIASILDSENIAVRAGHHCAMPLHERFNLPATVRASFYIYNTKEDVEKLIEGLKKVKRILK